MTVFILHHPFVDFHFHILCALQVVQWARGLQKYSVLHIHGLFTDPCGLVLDPSGYKDVMHDQDLMVSIDFEHF